MYKEVSIYARRCQYMQGGVNMYKEVLIYARRCQYVQGGVNISKEVLIYMQGGVNRYNANVLVLTITPLLFTAKLCLPPLSPS